MIERACIRGGTAALVARARQAFPSLTIEAGEHGGALRLEPVWLASARAAWAQDARVAAAAGRGPITVEVDAPHALPGLFRHQRFSPRRNPWSVDQAFDAVLERHRALHDLSRPLVAADYAHALDTWQWLLRLAPEASLAAQVAALFHDVERLVSEPDVRVEQHAADYAAFKDAHARAGARLVEATLAGLLPPTALARAAGLVGRHERPSGDAELALLNDADALSFFSLNAVGFLDYYGAAHTRKKVGYTLARLSAPARSLLADVGLPPAVARFLDEARAREATHGSG